MYLNKAYSDYNDNQAGLIVLSVYDDGTDADIRSYDAATGTTLSTGANYNNGGTVVNYPSVSASSGGLGVCNSYMPDGIATPTCILIAPDKSIVEPNIWSSSYDLSSIDSTLATYNISKVVTPIIPKSIKVQSSTQRLVFKDDNAQISLEAPASCELSVMSLDGKVLVRRDLGRLPAGVSCVEINHLGIASGLRVLSLKVNGVGTAVPIRLQ